MHKLINQNVTNLVGSGQTKDNSRDSAHMQICITLQNPN